MAHFVTDLVQHQAEVRPDAPAISTASDRLSYRELNRRADQLAHYLSTIGVNPRSVVGLYLERSARFPVAALAIMKLGCAYLPIDSKTPGSRVQMMLQEAQVSMCLTDSREPALDAGIPEKLVALADCAAEIGRCPATPVPTAVSAGQLAYVIYTSGSSGTPKAVAVGHDSLLNLIHWHNHTFNVNPDDRATQQASIGFDAAVWELWPHLAAGASVHLVDEEARAHPESLRDWLVRERITISFVATPMAERLLKLDWPRDSALRFLLTGADTLHNFPPADLPFVLVNNYGPTECTVVATSGIVESQEAGDRLPTIGHAIDNTSIYILDDAMKPVPTGTIGELYVGGACLAVGYLNDPELTKQKFVPDPFVADSGARLYRTGDLGCYLPDGSIAFHGRVDDQVKIRGYRIELGEVVRALDRHPQIRESTVVVGENGAGDRQLVAYIVPAATSLSVSELRSFLGKELPEFMIPAQFVAVDAIPIGSSGKVDRSALPAPNDASILRDDGFLSPSSPTEERVAAIIASLLGLERVGANDNFFYLGGNSLFGTQAIARIRTEFNVEIPLLEIFDHPTIADLAAEVDRLMLANLDAMSEEEAQRLLSLNSEQ
jgi:amino acid adenylation domain-containing protein